MSRYLTEFRSAYQRRVNAATAGELNLSAARPRPVLMPARSMLRCLMIVAMIGAWLALSNHCAVAALTTAAEATTSCPMHQKSPSQQKDGGTVCCKIIRAQLAHATAK